MVCSPVLPWYATKEESMNAELGRWLQTLREEQGYSQEGMARVLGVSVSAVRKWEQNLAEPRFKMQ